MVVASGAWEQRDGIREESETHELSSTSPQETSPKRGQREKWVKLNVNMNSRDLAI